MSEQFTCTVCGQTKPVGTEGGTGYGQNDKGEKICYDCCGKQDAEYMRTHDRITLYLTHDSFTDKESRYHGAYRDGSISNWPGTLKIPCRVKRGFHNIAWYRYDAWFEFEGRKWHGVQYGDNTQLVHCRALKGGKHA